MTEHALSAQNKTSFDEIAFADRRFLVGVFFFSCFVNVLALTGPLFMLQIYDRVLGSQSVETLVALTVLIAGIFVFMGLLDSARSILLSHYSARLQHRLDPHVFHAEMRDRKDHPDQGPRANRLRDLQVVRAFYASPTFTAIFDIVWSPVFFAALFLFHPMIGWFGIASAVVLILVTTLNQLITRRLSDAAGEAAEGALGFAAHASAQRELIVSQGMMADVTDRYRARGQINLNNAVRVRNVTGTFAAFTKALRLFLQSAMLAIGAYYVIQAEMTAGAMIAGSILLARGLQPIEVLLNGWQGLQNGRRAWRRVRDLLMETPAPPGGHDLTRPDATLKVTGLAVAPPGTKSPAIAGVRFQIQPGEAIGIISKSGSGKTTLGRALIAYWPHFVGEIRLGGANLDQFRPDHLGQLIGYLPQDVGLMPGTISENIARMRADPDPGAVEKAAKRAFAHDMILALPQGYDTVISDSKSRLSGGQRQRVGLARALFGDPLLLVLDEPNSALDGDGTIALNAAVQDFKDTGRMVVLMTHRPTAIERCDKLLVLENGQQKVFGRREEVLKQVLSQPVRMAS